MNAAPSWRRRALVRRAINAAITLTICLFALFPILWGLSTSLKPSDRILAFPPELLPSQPTLEHYRLLVKTGIHAPLANSAIVSVVDGGALAGPRNAGGLRAGALRVSRQARDPVRGDRDHEHPAAVAARAELHLPRASRDSPTR
jgi:hypothetical protein